MSNLETIKILEKVISSFKKIEEIVAGIDNLEKSVKLAFFKEACNLRSALMQSADMVSGDYISNTTYSVEYEIDGDIIRNDINE